MVSKLLLCPGLYKLHVIEDKNHKSFFDINPKVGSVYSGVIIEKILQSFRGKSFYIIQLRPWHITISIMGMLL